MREGFIQEGGYFFPAGEISEYLKTIKDTDNVDNLNITRSTCKNIVLMTHDDIFDPQIYKMEQDLGVSSTWFLDMGHEHTTIPTKADIQIHFNKELPFTLKQQIDKFERKTGKRPKYNRNHRLLWKSNNFDFPFLALNGVVIDTTLIGATPFIPVINGKVIPIVECPFSISDTPTRPMALYNVAKNIEMPFKRGLPLITVLAHPLEICKKYQLDSCFEKVIMMAEKYNYTVMSIDRFVKEELICGF